MNSYCPKQADIIASAFTAHETGESLTEPCKAFEAYLVETAETIPYMQAAKALPQEVILYLGDNDPDVEMLSEDDFI